ncbi:MAG: efflux RND transporter permease subunit [Paracoccaceae bacterium]
MSERGAPARFDRGGPIGWTARHPVVPNLLMLILIVGGLFAGLRMGQEVYPEYRLSSAEVTMRLPGAGPEQVYRAVALPLEQAISQIDGVEQITTEAGEGRAELKARLAEDADRTEVVAAIRDAISTLRDLPEDVRPARITAGTWQRPILSIALYGPAEPDAMIAAVTRLQTALRDAPEISQVSIDTNIDPAIRIEVARSVLEAQGLTLVDLARRVRAAAEDRGGGSVDTAGGEIALAVTARRESVADFAAIVVGEAEAEGGEARLLTLGDIATIRRTTSEDSPDLIFNGHPGVKLTVRQAGEETPHAIAAAARRVIAETEARLPQAIDVAIPWDASEQLDARMRLLGVNGLVGLALVLILLSLFLEIRLALWVAVGIPTAFLGSFLVLAQTGVTINMVSLFAFILALGLVVDDAIVAGENVYEYRERGLSPADAAVMGARDIAVPLSFSVVTNMLAFLPLAMVPGWFGQFWVVIPIVVALAFAISWLEALFVLPGHLAGVRRRDDRPGRGPGATLRRLQRATAGGLESFVRRVYGPALGAALSWRWATVAGLGLVAALLIAWPVSGRMGFSLFPPVKRDYAVMRVGLPLDAPREAVEAMRARMLETAERVAAEAGGRAAVSVIEAEIKGRRVSLLAHFPENAPDDYGAAEFVPAFREAIGPLPSAAYSSFGGAGGPGSGAGFEVVLAHPDEDVLERATGALAARLDAFAAVSDLDDGFQGGDRSLSFTVTAMGRALGFTPAEVAAQVRGAFYGVDVVRQVEGAAELRVRVSLPEDERRSEYDVETLTLRAPDGTRAPLYAIAAVERERGAREIERIDGRRTVTLEGRIADATARAQVLDRLGAEILPALEDAHPGLSTALGGDEQAKRDTVASFPLSISLTIALMYGALAVPFRSWVTPLVVLSAIPFGAAGAIAGHLVMGMGLTVVSLFGMIALGGVVINAALVMIDYAAKARAAGHDAATAIRLAGERRFRPILLTALTTFGGLAPMIFDESAAAAFLVPIAVAIGYGILFATLVVLFAIPCFYLMVEDMRWLLNPEPREAGDERPVAGE